jgi:hypothetical protein
MKTGTSVRATLKWRRMMVVGIALAALLALGLASGVRVYASHQVATASERGGAGAVLQDMPYLQDRPTGGRVWVSWVERCSALEGKYTFYRDELGYEPGEGSARTAGGRIFYYLVTEDDDEFAPFYCRGQSAY